MGQVLSPLELTRTLAPLRDASRIVATNGCFDLLHVGHLRYLQAARALGDLLIVAINSDQSVRNLKGPSRPIIPQEDRAELLAGLACVDYVVLFDEPTPASLLQQISPHIYVKGAQYTADNLPEWELLQSMGTRVEWVPMVENRSSSNLIERIQQLATPLP